MGLRAIFGCRSPPLVAQRHRAPNVARIVKSEPSAAGAMRNPKEPLVITPLRTQKRGLQTRHEL